MDATVLDFPTEHVPPKSDALDEDTARRGPVRSSPGSLAQLPLRADEGPAVYLRLPYRIGELRVHQPDLLGA